MSKLKSILLMGLSMVLVAALSIAGTVAYLSDEDSAVNVMTLGNVKIVQNEQQRDGNGGLEAFEQGKVLLPVTNTDAPINWPKGVEVEGITLPTVENFVDKIVTVDNVGSVDAYVRVLIAFPAEMDDDTSADNMMMRWIYDVNETYGTWSRTGGDVQVTIDGRVYNVYNCTYKAVLAPDATTASPAITGIFINSRVDATIDEDGAITYFMGNKSATYPAGEGPKLYVLSQGVQAAGFADANTALNAGFGEVNADNAATWFGGMDAQVPVVTMVSNATDLRAALANGGNIKLMADITATDLVDVSGSNYDHGFVVFEDTTIDLNGHTISLSTEDTVGGMFFVQGTPEDRITIKFTGDGNVEFSGKGNWIWAQSHCDVYIEGGNWTGVNTNVEGLYAQSAIASAQFYISGGTFDWNGTQYGSDYTNSVMNARGGVCFHLTGGTYIGVSPLHEGEVTVEDGYQLNTDTTGEKPVYTVVAQ